MTPPVGVPPASSPAGPPRRRPQPISRWAWGLLHLGRAGGGRAVGVLSVWLLWQALEVRRLGIRPVRPGSVVRYNLVRHRGVPVELQDGTRVDPGDLLLEVHLDSPTAASFGSDRPDPWEILRAINAELAWLMAHLGREELRDVKALHGIALLAAGGRRLGFEVRPLPVTWHWRLTRFFMVGMAAIYDPGGWTAARTQSRRWPDEIWMSRQAAQARFAPRAGEAGWKELAGRAAGSIAQPGAVDL